MSTGKENQDPNIHARINAGTKTEIGAEVGATPLQEIDEAPREPPKDPRLRRRVLPNPLIDDLNPDHLKKGVLIPLKTTQEVRQDHTIVQALITRAPTRCANEVLT